MSPDLPVAGNTVSSKPEHDASGAAATPDIPSTMQPVQPHIAATARAARIFVAVFLVVQVLLVGSALFIARTQWFLWHDGYPGLRNFGYAERAAHMNCDVLIYGDSSSLTGLDPSIIQQMTGLKSCNISEGYTEQAVIGSDRPMQDYLKQNPPPRFILGTWTPADFHPDRPPYEGFFPEGYMYELDFDSRGQLLADLRRDHAGTEKFITWILLSLGTGVTYELSGKGRRQIDARAQRDGRMGQWPYPLPPETHCVRPIPDFIARWQESVAAFRQKYSSPQTTVIVDISPVADCDASFDLYNRQAAGLHDNVFERVPIRFFNEGDVHFSAEGSRYISEQAARQILQRMHSAASPPPSGPAQGAR